jgi:hypothetical protein
MVGWKQVSDITHIEVFAQNKGIRDLSRLVKTYGGKNWRKCKGYAKVYIESTDETVYAELHWYEAHGVGKVEMKIKEFL